MLPADYVGHHVQPRDFREKPGAYLFIGNGPDSEGKKLHQVNYDFNDEILPVGASWWATLVEQQLPKRAG